MAILLNNYLEKLIIINFSLLISLNSGADCIKLRRFGVPGAVANGSSVWLHCDFDLEGDSLYSVKWYKNYEEFYGFLTENSQHEPEHKVYHQRGINIDLGKSNTTHVFLAWTDLNTEGTFGCEVSTEAPVFRTVKAEKDLRIYVAPTSHIRVHGIEDKYNMHDTINLTCIGGPSKPPMLMSWFINEKQVHPSLGVIHSISSVREVDGLSLSQTTLIFHLQANLMSTGDLIVRCEALFTTIYGITYKELIIEEKGYFTGSLGVAPDNININSNQNNNNFNRNKENDDGQQQATLSLFSPSSDNDYQVFSESLADYDEDMGLLKSPFIHGYRSRYSIGSVIQLNCSTQPSHPPAYIEWYINDREATDEELVYFGDPEETISLTSSIYDKFAVFGDSDLRASRLGLRFRLTKEHYQTSDGTLRLRCKATYAKIISWEKSKLIISSNGKQSSQLYASHSVSGDSEHGLRCCQLFIILFTAFSLLSRRLLL